MPADDEAASPLWDPFGLWRPSEGWRSAARFPSGLPASTTPLQWLLDVGRTRLVGRRVSWSLGGAPVEFEVQDINLAADSILLGAGQAEALTVTASDVVWGDHAFPAARATFHNVHTRPGSRPALVSAPIDLYLRVTADDVAQRIEARVPWLLVEITDSGELRARHRRRSDWGWVGFAVTPTAQGLAANLRTLTVAGRSWRLPSRLRPILIPLSLPEDARLKEVSAMPESLELRIRLDERRVEIKSAMSFFSASTGSPAGE